LYTRAVTGPGFPRQAKRLIFYVADFQQFVASLATTGFIAPPLGEWAGGNQKKMHNNAK
jgi:hypothetical protein